MAGVANTAAAHGYQPWALAASSANRGSSRRPAAALVRTGFAGAPNARAAGRQPRRRAVTVRTKAGAAGARPSSSSPDAVTYRASISTNTPLHDPPGASFDEYLQDRARVFRAMFPDESRSERLGDVRSVTTPSGTLSISSSARSFAESIGWWLRSERNCAGGVADPDAAAAVPPPHGAPRRRHAAAPPRRRARPPSHGVGAAGAGQRPRALELRPRRERVAVRGPEPRPPRRVPDEGAPRDRHHRCPPAAPAPRAGERPARRRRIGSVEAGGEDEAGRRRRPHRRLPEVPPGEGSSRVQGHANAGRSLKAHPDR